MAAFSSPAHIKDPVLKSISQESDHAEAEDAILKALRERGLDPDTDVADEELLKEMSVNFASARRCLYELSSSGDAFDVKRQVYEAAYKDGLKKLNEYMVAGQAAPSGGGSLLGTIIVGRG